MSTTEAAALSDEDRKQNISTMATEIAAQAWCSPATSGKEMDATLALEFASILKGWIEMAAQMSRDSDFYRGLLDQCAKHLGPEVYVSDDGSVQSEPLRLKVPELVAQKAQAHAAMCEHLQQIYRDVATMGRFMFDDGGAFQLTGFDGGASPQGLFGAVTCEHRKPDGTVEVIRYVRANPVSESDARKLAQAVAELRRPSH